LIIKKDSLIYRLAYVYNLDFHNEETDICELTIRVIKGLFCASLITATVALMSFCVFDSLIVLYVWMQTGYFELVSGLGVILALLLFSLGIAVMFGIVYIKETEPVQKMIDAHKNKYCFKVRIEG
jgi:hypothetical protein